MRTHLLQRAVLSHLLVAVPPALILGLLVVDINERNLREDAQQLHLSVAGRLRDAVEAEVRLQQAILRHGERLLSAPTGTLEEKKALLRALVAAGQLPWIAIYAPDGRLDSVVRPTEGAPPPAELAEAVRVAARTKGFGVGAPTFEGGTAHVAMAVPLTVEDEVRGYVVSSLEVAALEPEVKSLRASFLGQQGKLQIVSAGGVHLLAAGGPAAGNPVGRDAPFFGMSADEVGALAAAETGVSTAWVDHGGGSWLASLVSAPSLGWVVGSARPESVALASIDAVRRRTLLLALIAGLAAGLVGLLFARAVAGPVRALARAVRASAQGGFGARVEAQGPAELEAL
ncbi:MAG: HAMP domain-containing protein, partial [Myxococcales bacterium]|nr:HAMP domain-containing protein [Myxococcales bacterium]